MDQSVKEYIDKMLGEKLDRLNSLMRIALAPSIVYRHNVAAPKIESYDPSKYSEKDSIETKKNKIAPLAYTLGGRWEAELLRRSEKLRKESGDYFLSIKRKSEHNRMLDRMGIDKVIFNDEVTVVILKSGAKGIARKSVHDYFDNVVGFAVAYAIAKGTEGNKSQFKKNVDRLEMENEAKKEGN